MSDTLVLYHNPRCSKSRMAKAFLEEKGLVFETVEYLKNSLTLDELSHIISCIGIEAEDLIRKNEAVYKSEFKGKSLSEKEWIKAMIEHPKLMERPIVKKGRKAVVARPTELIEEIL